MRLEPADLGELISAIISSFSGDEISFLLLTRFGIPYTNIAANTLDDRARALRLAQYFQTRHEADQLVALLRDARPKVPALAQLAGVCGFISTPDMSALQVITRPRKGGEIGHDPASFRAELASREDAICRIVVGGTRYGTGTLVGQDIVLTNHHVVRTALRDDGTLAEKIVCQFDYRKGDSGYATPETEVDVSEVLASSQHAPEDLEPEQENEDKNLLDYAVLRLDRDLADAPIIAGGDPRGFTRIEPEPRDLRSNEGVLLLQHPDAQPLRLDLGAVSQSGVTRVRHTANTCGGSSGAPVFDGDLAFSALHHAGYDWPADRHPVNQAIPMSLVAADIRAKGIAV